MIIKSTHSQTINSSSNGSYRVGLYTKNKRMAGYLICDVLLGEYKLFNGDYRLTNKI